MAIHLPETAFHSPRRIAHRSLICIVSWLEVQLLSFPSPQAHRSDGLCCFNLPSELLLYRGLQFKDFMFDFEEISKTI